MGIKTGTKVGFTKHARNRLKQRFKLDKIGIIIDLLSNEEHFYEIENKDNVKKRIIYYEGAMLLAVIGGNTVITILNHKKWLF